MADDHLSLRIREKIEMSNKRDGNLTDNNGGENRLANEIKDTLSIPSGGENEMGNGKDDPLIIHITEKLHEPVLKWSGRKIFRVPEHLRNVNKKAYEPQVLAIGPYHHGKNHLMAMEEYKKWYLKMLLKRRGEQDVTRYVKSMRALEREARSCYEDLGNLKEDKFLEMMLLDGIFIVELLRKHTTEDAEFGDNEDPIVEDTWILDSIRRDMLLIENQLPFFVLQKLSDMTSMPNQPLLCVHRSFALFDRILPHKMLEKPLMPITEDSLPNIKHLVGLLHTYWRPSQLKEEEKSELKRCARPSQLKKEEKWELIRCATELKEAGVIFHKVDKLVSLFEIKFEHGVMEIPILKIEDETETLFRNLIAYEQFFLADNSNYVGDYVQFMDCLINSPKDVELLCQHGIIDNWLGDDDVVAKMFNRLCDFVNISTGNFYYSALFINVNNHCSRRWNKWMAALRHNYFNTPWALISFVAAVFLLLLTVAQTALSFIDYFK